MLDNLKMMLGLDTLETDIDDKLNFILSGVEARLKFLLGGIEPPEEMNYIIIDVALKRFNRIGSEGLSSQSVEGASLTFSNSDFDEFSAEIQAFVEKQEGNKRGRVRFI